MKKKKKEKSPENVSQNVVRPARRKYLREIATRRREAMSAKGAFPAAWFDNEAEVRWVEAEVMRQTTILMAGEMKRQSENRKEEFLFAPSKNGEFWHIRFKGQDLPPVKNSKGMGYIHSALRHFAKNKTPFDVRSLIPEGQERSENHKKHEHEFYNARYAETNRRIADLLQSISAARAYLDSPPTGGATTLHLEKVEKKLEDDTAVLGSIAERVKGKWIPSDYKNHRDPVKQEVNTILKNIRRAKGQLSKASPKLYAHLSADDVWRTDGGMITYSGKVKWVLE